MQAVILAAGSARRMGKQKLLMPYGPGRIIDCVIDTVANSGFETVFLVTSLELGSKHFMEKQIRILFNPDPDRGIASSLRIGVSALNENSSFAIFLGDKPLITVNEVRDLRQSFEHSMQSALIPRKNRQPGHPGFYKPLWKKRFLKAEEEEGKKILLRYEDEIEWVEAPESCFFDVDTPEDYEKLLELPSITM